ncbi:MAG TPA: SHOCT domain-containing protein [Acidimicrobiia bacterium]|nr:SHOCT domain-containing protein [Acidimicrobiia bacterium]
MPLFDVFSTLLWLAIMFTWFWLVVMVFADVIRSDDLSGWAKAAWVFVTVFLPYLGVFGYLIARGGSMWKRRAREKAVWKQMNQGYVTEVPGGPTRAEELAKLAELHDRGVITTAEFDRQRALWLG